MFKQRLISGVLLVLLTVFALYMGGMVAFSANLILSLIGYIELLRNFKI